MNERLSAFYDNELSVEDSRDAAQELASNTVNKQVWTNYSTLSSALNSAAVPAFDYQNEQQFAAKFDRLLTQETPHTSVSERLSGTSNVLPFLPSDVSKISYTKPLYAVAASAALVAAVVWFKPVATPIAADLALAQTNTQDVQALLVEHGEFTGLTGLNGLATYAKIINSTPMEIR